MSFPAAPTQRKDSEDMKEKKRLGHDDRINLQALHLRTGRAETGSKGTCVLDAESTSPR